MMTLKRAIEVLQATDGAGSIEMTQETKEAIEMAEAALIDIDMQLDVDPKVCDKCRAEETPVERRITFGELLDLIDSEREGDDAIELMGHNGEVDIAGRISSAYFVAFEDRVVNSFGAHNNAVQVWLED